MRHTLTILTMAVIVLTAAGAKDQLVFGAVVTVGTGEVKAGETVSIPVTLSDNGVGVCAILLPIQYPSEALTLDSVSFEGSIWTDDFAPAVTINNTAHTVQIMVLPEDMVDPLPQITVSSGVLAHLFFRAAGDASAQIVPVDSIFEITDIGAGIVVEYRAQISDNGNHLYYPEFAAGAVNIKVPTGIDDLASGTLPTEFELTQNYPNPFNPSTVIGFGLPTSSQVRLAVFNILGQQVRVLYEGHLEAGNHQIDFNAENLPSGIYFYRLTHDGGALTRKMMLVK